MEDTSTRVAEAFAKAGRLDPLLGTYLRQFPEPAAKAAAELDAQTGERGPLHGLLLGVKDVVAVREAPTTGQSNVHDAQWWAGRDAVAVQRLREAGAVVLGKTTMAEHALSRPDPALDFPVPRNPWDPDRWTGGSSCGSANGLPAGLFDAAVGTDTNGSIRIPAALCGVTGFKPTYGLVPVEGCRPLSRSLDTPGSLARTVREATGVLAVMAGRDVPETWRTDLRGVRVGVPTGLLDGAAALSEDCKTAFDQALDVLREAGAEVVDVDLSEVFPLVSAQFVTMLAEAFELHGGDLKQRWAEYGRPFRRNVALGGLASASAYVRAQRVRKWAAESLRARFGELTVIATPTWPSTAPRYDDPVALQQVSWLPGTWSAVGFPAVAVPMGFGADGLPLSLQLAAKPWDDFALAAIADVYQRQTGWHLRRPEPDPDRPPAAVAPPQSAPGTEEQQATLATALGGIGITVDAAELAELSGTWAGVSMLFGAVPEMPVDVGSFASIAL
jgi:aspartyl-tRNA(Asn)/glutamyl-tRNA(Gln) amidotransferase subunit A